MISNFCNYFQNDPHAEEPEREDVDAEPNPDEAAQHAESYGKKSHETQNVEQAENAQDAASSSQNEQEVKYK